MLMSIYGAGELGSRVAALWPGEIAAITATDRRHDALREDLPDARISTEIGPPGDQALISAPSSSQPAVLDQLERHPPPRHAVLISSTGVYSPQSGLVTADSPPGTSDRARRLEALERRFSAWAPNSCIVRLGGLFHASRGPAAAFARTGRARLGPPNTPLALIHYDDAASLVLQVLQSERTGIVLGVTHQPTRHDFYTHQVASSGHPMPAFSAPVSEPPAYQLLPSERDWQS